MEVDGGALAICDPDQIIQWKKVLQSKSCTDKQSYAPIKSAKRTSDTKKIS